ncbi:hypothetical protein M0813_20151 [Anaeramoeba flamelloides]|uniref:CSC1/OSCA1-like cytosolic domain-containing protein n=1 Tax=Anaeramoeba flamelloides TaxID=1746091 RepID=A0ABQ8YMA6_9EUKA|nr:hypothetical protein M0813_20151 [Anaeramoeba flamelloides]
MSSDSNRIKNEPNSNSTDDELIDGNNIKLNVLNKQSLSSSSTSSLSSEKEKEENGVTNNSSFSDNSEIDLEELPKYKITPKHFETISEEYFPNVVKQYQESRIKKLYHSNDSDKPKLLSLWETNMTNSATFGLGISLYFKLFQALIKFYIFLLIPSTILLIFHTKSNQPGFNEMISHLTIIRQDRSALGVYEAMGTIGAISFFFFIFFFRRSTLKFIANYFLEERQNSISDFTILVSGLPRNYDLEKVREFFAQFGEIKHIEQTYRIRKFLELYDSYYKLQKRIFELESLNKTSSCCCSLNLGKLPIKYLSLSDAKRKFYKLEKTISNLHLESTKELRKCPTVLVIYTESISTVNCLKKIRFNPFQKLINIFKKLIRYAFCLFLCKKNTNKDQYRKFGNKLLNVRRAPEPSDLLWTNLDSTYWNKFFRKIFKTFFTIFLIMLTFLIIFNISKEGYQSDSDSPEEVSNGDSFTITVIIFVSNRLLIVFLNSFSNYSRNFTRTENESNTLLEIIFSQALNSGVLVVYLIIVIGDNIVLQLPNMINMLIIANFYCVPFTAPVITHFLHKRKIKKALKKLRTIYSLDKVFQPPKTKLFNLYFELLYPLILSLTFWPSFPIIVLITLFGLIIMYYCHKYRILRQSDRKYVQEYSHLLHKKMVRYFPFLYLLPILAIILIYFSSREKLYEKEGNTLQHSIGGYILLLFSIVFTLWNLLIRNARKVRKQEIESENSEKNEKKKKKKKNKNKLDIRKTTFNLTTNHYENPIVKINDMIELKNEIK